MTKVAQRKQSNTSIDDLARDIDTIKNNHLFHMALQIDEVKEEMKEQRSHFNLRMDRLDNRLWAIMLIAVTTLIGIIAQGIM